jgi:hypothetical protein
MSLPITLPQSFTHLCEGQRRRFTDLKGRQLYEPVSLATRMQRQAALVDAIRGILRRESDELRRLIAGISHG